MIIWIIIINRDYLLISWNLGKKQQKRKEQQQYKTNVLKEKKNEDKSSYRKYIGLNYIIIDGRTLMLNAE